MEQNIKLNNLLGHIIYIAISKFYKQNICPVSIEMNELDFFVEFKCDFVVSINDFNEIEKIIKDFIASKPEIRKINSITNPNKYQNFLIKQKQYKELIKINDFENVNKFEIEEKISNLKFFKLLSVGGSNWLGDTNNDKLTRITAVAFNSKNELKEFEEILENQKKYDHRKLGQDMQIFTFDEEIGQGLPIWLPNGTIIKKQIKKYLWSVFEKYNFNFVDTPILGSKSLYVKSGHWDHYKENNFPPLEIDNETFMLRPMTCPHHINIYNYKPKSYKELPYYVCEDSKLHRYESSGGLIGLERVRSMELFDCHIFAKENDIEQVIEKLDSILKEVHEKMKIQIDRIDLSLHDPKDSKKYHNDKNKWKNSENQLRKIVKNIGYDAVEMIGEAAFYGPKIDYQAKSNLGKMITISTIQLDFLLVEKFNLSYIDEQNLKQRPVLIHFGVIGTYERFIATLLSQTKGILPLWICPIQVCVIPVNESLHKNYCLKINEELQKNNIRSEVILNNERFSKKIRQAQISKIPYQIIIGDDEIKFNKITIRKYSENNSETVELENFIKIFK